MASKHVSKRRRLIILLGVVVAIAAYVLGWSSLFSVKQVLVIGAPNPSEAYATQHSVPIGEKLARLEPRSVSVSLKKFPWLDHATISRNWFKGEVTIRVWTRTPIAVFQGHLMDGEGVTFDLPNVDTSHLPTITATNAASGKFGAQLLLQLPIDLRDQVISVAVHGSHLGILSIKNPTKSPSKVLTLVWGDLADMSLKVQVYHALLALPENAKVSTVDVSAPHAPIVK